MSSSISRSSSHSSITNDVTLNNSNNNNNNNNNTNHQSKKQLKNTAFVFIKPLVNQKQKDTKDEDDSSIYTLVRTKLLKNNIKINFECTTSSNQIDKSNIIDKHYYNIASKALYVLPKDLTCCIDVHLFQRSYGVPWHSVIRGDKIYNAKQCETMNICTVEELYKAWNEADQNKQVIKLGHGCYCGKLTLNQKTIYVINGFYPYKRSHYTMSNDTNTSHVRGFVIEWNYNKLPWKDFNANVIGDIDPTKANENSIRRIILDNYKKYGLKEAPTKYNNIIHASTSPLEGLKNRCNWLGRAVIDDEFGKVLLYKGITEHEIKEWMKDNRFIPLPTSPNGEEKGSILDYLRGCDADDCVDRIVDVCDVELGLVRDSGAGCSCSIM